MMTIKIEGLEAAIKTFHQMPLRFEREIPDALFEIATKIKEDARRLAPYRTGALRASIVAEVLNDGMSARVYTDLYYAPFMEFGTRYITPRPFLAPAVQQNRGWVQQYMAQVVKRIATE